MKKKKKKKKKKTTQSSIRVKSIKKKSGVHNVFRMRKSIRGKTEVLTKLNKLMKG